MNTTYFTYESLSFNYTDTELKDVIDEILKQYDEDSISFISLCDSLMYKAKNENKLNCKPNTVYLSNNLDNKEYERISLVLWKKIWNHELCLNFHVENTMNRDYRFIKIKHDEKKCRKIEETHSDD